MIEKESFILDGTVRQNIDPRSSYNEDELRSCLKTANLTIDLNKDIDQEISAEHAHLLSVVRCLLKKPRVVILQEPNTRSDHLFPDSTVIAFSEQPRPDFEGRIIKMLSGEVAVEDFDAIRRQ